MSSPKQLDLTDLMIDEREAMRARFVAEVKRLAAVREARRAARRDDVIAAVGGAR